jgi:ABC-type polysaccharide/polyol phosphate export permease
MDRKRNNYWQLIWSLAGTDFKLRFHGSILGYIWALLKPFSIFLILNFVFSSIFNPLKSGTQYYSIQLIVSIIIFNFFAEGTMFGLNSLVSKSTLITKVYIPRWIIIVASTIQSMLLFLMNIIVIVIFFVWYSYWPGISAVFIFAFYSILTYILIVSFSFIAAPIYVKFRDLSHIWEVTCSALFYASPVIYPLNIIPSKYRMIILVNPMGFIVHFTKTALTENHMATLWQNSIFTGFVLALFLISLAVYHALDPNVADNI